MEIEHFKILVTNKNSFMREFCSKQAYHPGKLKKKNKLKKTPKQNQSDLTYKITRKRRTNNAQS